MVFLMLQKTGTGWRFPVSDLLLLPVSSKKFAAINIMHDLILLFYDHNFHNVQPNFCLLWSLVYTFVIRNDVKMDMIFF